MDSLFSSQIDKIIQNELDRNPSPSLVVGIMQDHKILYEKFYGNTNLVNGSVLDRSSVFRVASITKLFTTIGILQLWEQKKFRLDDEVNLYLPKGKLISKKKNWPRVTFRDLLTHQSGIGILRSKLDLLYPSFRQLVLGKNIPPEKIPSLNILHDLPLKLSYPAKSKFYYSNLAFSLLGYLIELLSGVSYRDYIYSKILQPLEMNHSDLKLTPTIAFHLVSGYHKIRKGFKPVHFQNLIISPAGGLYSTLDDLLIFASCLLNQCQFSNGALLYPETMKMAISSQYFSNNLLKDDYSLGLAFWKHNIAGTEIIFHHGCLNGFTSSLNIIPSKKIAIVVLANSDDTWDKRTAYCVRNSLIKYLLHIPNDFEKIKNGLIVADKSYWPLITGYYGRFPGILSNEGAVFNGSDFRIREYAGSLWFQSICMGDRTQIRLYSTENPLVYCYPMYGNEEPTYCRKIAFKVRMGKKGYEVYEMNRNLDRFRKIKRIQTFRWKIELITTLGVVGVLYFIFHSLFL